MTIFTTTTTMTFMTMTMTLRITTAASTNDRGPAQAKALECWQAPIAIPSQTHAHTSTSIHGHCQLDRCLVRSCVGLCHVSVPATALLTVVVTYIYSVTHAQFLKLVVANTPMLKHFDASQGLQRPSKSVFACLVRKHFKITQVVRSGELFLKPAIICS